ncbi:MAG: hypothetical protein LLF94_08120 [Chlamydiales bacterium]|nr:hypothetical protein [Chlamydiales bacterium]
MVHASDYAVTALDEKGFVEFTYDSKGHTVYLGHVITVDQVVQKAKQKDIRIDSQRIVIDNGSYTFVVSKAKRNM